MEITKQYRNNDKLRSSFNRLAEQTFGLNFETGIRTDFGAITMILIPLSWMGKWWQMYLSTVPI